MFERGNIYMYKTILCAIEASQEGKMVLAKAAELANLCGAKLIVIHVLPYKLRLRRLQLPLASPERIVT